LQLGIIDKNPYNFSAIARLLSMLYNDLDRSKVFVPKKC